MSSANGSRNETCFGFRCNAGLEAVKADISAAEYLCLEFECLSGRFVDVGEVGC